MSNFDMLSTSAAEPIQGPGLIELTKNSKYCVSKLPAIPPVLRDIENSDQPVSGCTDPLTYYSLIVTPEGSYIWDYYNSDSIPETYFFPSENGETQLLGTLVSPVVGVKDPGLITVECNTGLMTYWTSTGGAVATNILHSRKSITHQIKLHGSEVIEKFERIETVGIIATTSVGRFIFITFRDSVGKPCLKSETMRGSGVGFLASLKGAVTLSSNRRRVVSIKPGKVERRDKIEALMITEAGNFLVWDCFRNGQTNLVFEENLRDILLNTLSTLSSNANATFQIHDLEYHPELNYVYILSSFINNPETLETFYFVFTLSLEQNFVRIVSTHKIRTFSLVSNCQPKLLLPNPYQTLFVSFSRGIILLDAVKDHPQELNKFHRWEDAITLLPGIDAFAFGEEGIEYKGGKVSKYPGIIVMTRQKGLFRVEKYDDGTRFKEDNTESPAELAPQFIKTRVEQAIFYGYRHPDVNPVDFEINKALEFPEDVLNKIFLQVSDEIITSTSPYIPPVLPSTGEHLSLRWDALQHLGEYLARNFPESVSTETRLALLWNMEKIEAAKQIWQNYDHNLSNQSGRKSPLPDIIIRTSASKDRDPVRYWFLSQVREISSLLYEASMYNKSSPDDAFILEQVNGILICAIWTSAFKVRVDCGQKLFDLNGDEYSSECPWTSTPQVLDACETQYTLTTKMLKQLSSKDPHYDPLKEHLVFIVKCLCEVHSKRIDWLRYINSNSSYSGDLSDAINNYHEKRGGWIKSLAAIDKKEEARIISEHYKIYRSLAELLGDQYKHEIDTNGHETVLSIGILETFRRYIRDFGYDFAKVLFQYYVETEQLRSLLKQYTEFDDYLDQFLNSQEQYGRFSWIHDISKGNDLKASRTLLNVAVEKEGLAENKRLQLSIAKLCVLAQGPTEEASTIALYNDITSEMRVVEIQDALSKQFLFYNPSGEKELNVDRFSKFISKHQMKGLKFVLGKATKRLRDRKPLTVQEFVDILSLIDTEDSTNAEYNFFRALQLITLQWTTISSKNKISSDQYKFYLQTIWRRLFLRDDWKSLVETENKSDSFVQNKFENSLLYKTIQSLVADGILSENDDEVSKQLLNFIFNPREALWSENPEDIRNIYPFAPKDQEVISKELKKENEILERLLTDHSIQKWIQGIYTRATGSLGKEPKGNSTTNTNTTVPDTTDDDVEMGD